MRVPKDIPLAVYIQRLIEAGSVEQFYLTDDWQELRAEVLAFYHYECQTCLKLGKYTRAVCVHHVNEVRRRPALALSKYFVDVEGNTKPNLLPLCNACHNKEHPEKFKKNIKKDGFSNVERW